MEATGRSSYESASAIAAIFSVPVAELLAGTGDELVEPFSIAPTKRKGVRRAFVSSSIAASVVLAGLVFLANPFGAVSPELGEFVARLTGQLCVYDEKSYSIGSNIRAVRGVDGAGDWIADEPDVPILSCERNSLRARWQVIGPHVKPEA
jgi:hypothetical protein